MEDVSKTPRLALRKGVYYLRVRVPETVRKAISDNVAEWNRLTKSRTPLEREWRKLRGEKSIVKDEILRSLKEREKKAAERALVKEQFKLNSMFEEIERRLTLEGASPSTADVEGIALSYFGSINERAMHTEASSRTEVDTCNALQVLDEDIANAGTHEPSVFGRYVVKARQLLSKAGFSSEVRSEGVIQLASLLQRSDIELARRAKDRYQRNFSTRHDDFFPPASKGNNGPTNSYNFGQLIDDFRNARFESGIKAKAKGKYEALFRIAQDVIPSSTPIVAITRMDCKRVESIFRNLPANHTKIAAIKNLSAEQAVHKAQELGLSPMSKITASNYLHQFSSLFRWAVNETLISQSPAENLSVGRPEGLKRDAVHPYSERVLSDLFSTDALPTFRYTHPSCFWVPLISLFSGMRLNEALQLHVTDLRTEQGIDYFYINDEDETGNKANDKSLKRTASRRSVPVHSELIKLGFLAHVKRCKIAKVKRIFEDATISSDGSYSSKFSKWYRRFLKRHGHKTRKLNFHSFRHTFRDALRNADVPSEAEDEIGGWETTSSAKKNYGSGRKLKKLKEEVEKVRYEELDLSHLYQEEK